LVERRKSLHERAAVAIETIHSGSLEDNIKELVHHYGRSANREKAFRYMCLAAAQAMRRSDYDEALDYAQRALKLLGQIRELPEHMSAEFDLQLIIARAASVLINYTAPEVEQALARAAEICQKLPDRIEKLPEVLTAQLAFCFVSSNHSRTSELANRFIGLGENIEDQALLSGGHFCLGASLFWRGHPEALDHLNQALSCRRIDQTLYVSKISGVDDGVFISSYLALVLWFQGYPDQGRQRRDQAIERAASLNHPYSVAIAKGFSLLFDWFVNERVSADDVQELSSLSTESGFPHLLAFATIFASLNMIRNGRDEMPNALSELLSRWHLHGVKIELMWTLTALADTYTIALKPERALRVVADACAEMELTSERRMEPELYRIKGESYLLQDASNVISAEEQFRKAIDVAQQQNAKSSELRSTIRLSRLLSNEERQDEARTMLANIYNWFTEGFDTRDLQEAKQLLDELAVR
jgi:tetratricopeptide (TPR) repeat protein